MTDTENYNEVFKKFPYQLVKQKDCDIRRYRGWIYTKWKAGQFVSFVYLTDGLPLFDEAVKAHTMTEKSGDESVFSYLYAVEQKSDYVDWGGNPVQGMVDDNLGDTIFCEVNMYRGTKKYKVYSYDKILRCTLNENELIPYRMACFYSFRTMRDDVIATSEKPIIEEYQPHKQKIDDAEFNYLQRQVHHIQHMLETGQSELKNDDLQNLLTHIKQRLKQLKPIDSRQEARNIHMTTLLARLKCV